MKLSLGPGPLRERYVSARSFPHIVLDSLFPDDGRPDEERSAPHDTIFRKTHEHEW